MFGDPSLHFLYSAKEKENMLDLNSHILTQDEGFIDAVMGPMFSAKTKAIFDYINEILHIPLRFENNLPIFREVFIFSHVLNIRDKKRYIKTRSMGGKYLKINATLSDDEIIALRYRNFSPSTVIVAEEFQFVGYDFVNGQLVERKERIQKVIETLEFLREQGHLIICSMLDMSFRREPFLITGPLAAIANNVHKRTAACSYPGCKNRAHYSQRLLAPGQDPNNVKNVDTGDAEKYAARCLHHHTKNPEVLSVDAWEILKSREQIFTDRPSLFMDSPPI